MTFGAGGGGSGSLLLMKVENHWPTKREGTLGSDRSGSHGFSPTLTGYLPSPNFTVPFSVFEVFIVFIFHWLVQ